MLYQVRMYVANGKDENNLFPAGQVVEHVYHMDNVLYTRFDRVNVDIANNVRSKMMKSTIVEV